MKKILNLMIAVCCVLSCAFIFSGCFAKNEEPTKSYIVQFYNYDGTLVKELSVNENSSAICETPTKASTQYYVYEFSNWEFLDGTDATDDLASVTKTLTVRAKFNEVQPTYTLTFYDDDGQELSKTSVLRGHKVECPEGQAKTTEYFNLSFNCWVGENGGIYNEEIINVERDMEFVAKYDFVSQHTECPVEFYDEDGETLLKTINMMHGDYTKGAAPTHGKAIDEFIIEHQWTQTKIEFCYVISGWEDGFGNEVNKFDAAKGLKLYAINSDKIKSRTRYDGYGNELLSPRYYCEFTLSQDKTYFSVTRSSSGHLSYVPKAINSIPVTHISCDLCPDSNGIITIPEGVTTIDEQTSYTDIVKKLVLPSTLIYMDNEYFLHSSSLEEVNYLGDMNSWVNIEFTNQFYSIVENFMVKINGEIPTTAKITTATQINQYALTYFNITSMEISDTVRVIKKQPFTSISQVNYLGDINDWATIDFEEEFAIGSLKFNGETILNAVIDRAEYISDYAFKNCSFITLEIGSSVKSIGQYAFNNSNNPSFNLTNVRLLLLLKAY